MRDGAKSVATKIFEIFAIRFANFSQQEALEAWEALAIVKAHLGDEPIRLAAAAGATEADGGRSAGMVTEARGGAGVELFGMQQSSGIDEVIHLVTRTAGATGGGGEMVGKGHGLEN